MPLLTDALVASYFTSGEWRICLYLGDVEVASLTPAWTLTGAEASTLAVFVFGAFAHFDQLTVERDGYTIESYPYEGVVAIPPGMEWAHDLAITMSEAV